MLKKCLELMQRRAPSIRLELNQASYHAGDKIEGHIQILGGWRDQDLNRLDCDLVIKNSATDKIVNIKNVISIFMSKQLKSNEQIEKPFTFRLPEELEPSSGTLIYELQTKLVFANEKCARNDRQVRILE
ncbi:SpoOM protein [Terribacillus halophilus]|uniref:SpoOM protein n=1 Tax=Terribacillus halophilus TaxID=361279 RepID=A0A1G6TE16_9BACI|nr:sporulation protein [Terribacillus halophilus]SDD27104.1 SpoOM protein [Terribacillus halophilus]